MKNLHLCKKNNRCQNVRKAQVHRKAIKVTVMRVLVIKMLSTLSCQT